MGQIKGTAERAAHLEAVHAWYEAGTYDQKLLADLLIERMVRKGKELRISVGFGREAALELLYEVAKLAQEKEAESKW